MRFIRMLAVSCAPLAVVFMSACGDGPPPEESDTAAVAAALSAVPALFDSIQWTSQKEALDRGSVVYSYSCERCHGRLGAGDGGYRLAGRVVRPPSFLRDDWRFAADFDGLRAMIQVGNPRRGMPHWEEKGLTPRDTDAVARYITWGLWARR